MEWLAAFILEDVLDVQTDALNVWLLSASRFYTRRLKLLRRLIHLLSASIGRI